MKQILYSLFLCSFLVVGLNAQDAEDVAISITPIAAVSSLSSGFAPLDKGPLETAGLIADWNNPSPFHLSAEMEFSSDFGLGAEELKEVNLRRFGVGGGVYLAEGKRLQIPLNIGVGWGSFTDEVVNNYKAAFIEGYARVGLRFYVSNAIALNVGSRFATGVINKIDDEKLDDNLGITTLAVFVGVSFVIN